jgi:hypothetical protein
MSLIESRNVAARVGMSSWKPKRLLAWVWAPRGRGNQYRHPHPGTRFLISSMYVNDAAVDDQRAALCRADQAVPVQPV